MMTFKEVIELRDKLASGEIDLAFAKSQYWKDFKDGERSWKTQDWKERRAKVIKDQCQLCCSKDTLTLEHRSHPRKYLECLANLTKMYITEYIDDNPEVDKDAFLYYIVNNYDYLPAPMCPNCWSSSPNKRLRKTPSYLCTACRHEFNKLACKSVEELVSIFFDDEGANSVRNKLFVSKDEWKNKQNLSNIRYWMQREQAKNEYGEIIEREAFLLYLADSIKYLSFEDTITACKKCAFNLDMKGLDLCPKCKEHYKGLQYPTCIQCLPEEKRKTELASIEFGRQWHQIHKNLGIE